ncbi:hydroxyproline-rich glycoprotein family protein [Striga asiatica]|uniref:Hydroxyproline-rich glycoprotein family protein n=1 Tax=Striga asiatica TaxID=4170 RepID=A0A5A7NWQ1_STRAF|nr:hydroxyproline-rich glycoprotein family protein [Striga asiatica]
MGKADNQRLPVVQPSNSGSASATFFPCRRCAMGCFRLSSVKCGVVLALSLAAFLSAFFWLLPIRYRQAGFDAKDSIKLSATVQSYFKLQKPVHELVPYVARLEYDINDEIGVPSSKVAVLSMHQAELPNQTYVVFGFLPDPINSTMNIVALTLLKSSLIDLFLEQYNLTLTSSIFGEPSSFEILKFPGGFTIIPEQVNLITQPLMNFTLNSSIYDIKENLKELKDQLRFGLHLMPNEVVYIQVTSRHGSTKDSPVTVEASVASDKGTILPERLIQLAQIITGSPPTENLGLDHSIFGKVKEISLSSFLNHSLYAPTPAPIPTPTPSPDYPAFAPQIPPSLPPSSNCHSPSPISYPEQISPNLSPQPVLRPQSSPGHPLSGAPYSSQAPVHVSSSFLNTCPCKFRTRHLEDTTAVPKRTFDFCSIILDILNNA